MQSDNPCLSCGACCSHFRVSFYWGEAEPEQGGIVPAELTENLPPFRVCMKGTNQNHPRCVALDGLVGEAVRCTIYDLRPSPCREFGVHFEHNALWFDPGELERCNHARQEYGLGPIVAPDSEPAVKQLAYLMPENAFWHVLALKQTHHQSHGLANRKMRHRRRPGGGTGNNFPSNVSSGMGA